MALGFDGVDSYILMVDMDCKENVRRVKKAVCSCSGIDYINIDAKENKVHLKGNFDINRVVEAIRHKSNGEIRIICPSQNKPKGKESLEITVDLRVPFDCQTCARKVRDTILSIDGVSYIKIDEDNDKVTVKGFDINAHMICYKLCSELGLYSEILAHEKPKPKPPVEKPQAPPEIKHEKDGDIHVHVVNNIYPPASPFSDEEPNPSCSIM